jgi:hypothetical protein
VGRGFGPPAGWPPGRAPARERSPSVEDNVFFGNTANEGGGIRFCFFTGVIAEPTIRRNAVFDNTALTKGGGMSAWDADPFIENCTFDGNSAGVIGGGVHVSDDAVPPQEATLLNSIVTNSVSGGGVANEGAALTMAYDDVWNNAGGDYVNCSPGSLALSADPLFCDPPDRDFTLRDDSPCLPWGNPWGVLIGAYGLGDCGTSAGNDTVPGSFRLEPPFPSPARGPVVLTYQVPAPGTEVALTVLTVSGRAVRHLRDVPRRAGSHRVIWDGADDAGRPVASGVYVIKGSADGVSAYRGVVVLRR